MSIPWVEISPFVWEISKEFKKKIPVPVRFLASKEILQGMEEEVVRQLTNVAFLPGVVQAVWAMPDAHQGYGAPIGGVFATNPAAAGVVSPGAIGFDINCGVRLLTTSLSEDEVRKNLESLMVRLFSASGAGIGAQGDLFLNQNEVEKVCLQGAKWVIDQGWGRTEDLEHCEERGCLETAEPAAVSKRALERGRKQLGTLGSGNHYLEIQTVDKIVDSQAAMAMGIRKEKQVTIMIHCGSRGLGHQVATDYLGEFGGVMQKYKITVADRQLACAPLDSEEGARYLGAMAAAVNFAFANRQLLTYKVREVFGQVFKTSPESLGLSLVYDVAHNVAKWENNLLVHRKGATRAWGPNQKDLPSEYQAIGQPVLVGGSLETASWVLLGTKKAEQLTFASSCHGAGRVMSRTAAKQQVWGESLIKELRGQGILVKTASFAGLAEEAGLAYKDVDVVVNTVADAGISRPVARLRPIGVIKG